MCFRSWIITLPSCDISDVSKGVLFFKGALKGKSYIYGSPKRTVEWKLLLSRVIYL